MSTHRHDHDHDHDHHHHEQRRSLAHGAQDHRPEEKRRLRIAIAVTATAMVVEIVGGVMTGSLALISDAGHMLTHSFALGVSLLAAWIASRPTSPERSFGLYRVEVLAALFNAVTLAVITAVIAHEAYERLITPRDVDAWSMFGVAVFGLVVNVGTAWILHGAGHDDLNFRSAFLHMIGDTLSSVVIVIGAVAIRYTGWTWVDPVLSVMICVVILVWAWGLTRDSIRILMEAAPKGLRVEAVRAGVRDAFAEVTDVRDVHLWTITSGLHAMTACVAVAPGVDLERQRDLAHRLRHYVEDEFSIGHAVFEFQAG